jgi:hypothetical protein
LAERVNPPLAAERLQRLRKLRLPFGIACFAVVTVVTVLVAHPRLFGGFSAYDDEGYMLTALKSFLNHGHLYNDVFSQYGPFYYEFWGGFFEIFGLPVTHDGGRTATLVAWVLAALIFGLSLWRMTDSLLLGLSTQIVVFEAIGTVTNEPMHPGGLICLLLGALIAFACFVRARSSPLAMAFVGGATMALILVKINVGIFALLALALACAVSYAFFERRRWLRLLIEAAFVVIPFAVMASRMDEAWVRHYAVHVAVAALAVVVVLRARRSARRPEEELRWVLGGLLVLGAVVCLALIAAGTTPGGLIEGVVSQPLRQSDAFDLALGMGNGSYLFDLFGLLGAVAFWYFARRQGRSVSPWLIALAAAASVVIGLEMALAPIAKTELLKSFVFPYFGFAFLPFAWVALIPLGPQDEDTAFARLLLPPLAVLQALHAFPVAGSQTQWAVFLLVPTGVLCVAGGLRALVGMIEDERRRQLAVAAVAVGAVVIFAMVVNTQLRQPLRAAEAAYDAATPLDLPGAEDVRLEKREDVLRYRRITAAIDENCGPMLMLPGMDSFYLWAQREPPTGYNATAWTTLFDDAHQERVIRETRSIEGLCLLENEGQARGWTLGRPPEGPLVRYLHQGFRPLFELDGYRLLRREGKGTS